MGEEGLSRSSPSLSENDFSHIVAFFHKFVGSRPLLSKGFFSFILFFSVQLSFSSHV